MLDWLKKIFKKEEVLEDETSSEIGNGFSRAFTIEHYPMTNRYYPKYDDYFLYKDPDTGLYRMSGYMPYSEYSETLEGAKKIIDEYKELQLKEGIKVYNI